MITSTSSLLGSLLLLTPIALALLLAILPLDPPGGA